MRTTSRAIFTCTTFHSVTRRVECISNGVSTSSATMASSITRPERKPSWRVGTKLENISTKKPAASASDT